MKKEKRPGAPKKEPTTTPSLRCKKSTWDKAKKMHAGKINGYFNEWLEELVNNNNLKSKIN